MNLMQISNYALDLARRTLPSFSSSLSHVGTYSRDLPNDLHRMYENALDYEHLPWLHSSTFASLQIHDSGSWGWLATVHIRPKSVLSKMVLELRLDRDNNRWITKTLSGLGKGTEIWTVALPSEDGGIRVVVDFFIPKVPGFMRSFYRQYYMAMYKNLYDEDESMMVGRQQGLNRVKTAGKIAVIEGISLGYKEEVRAALPMQFEFNQKNFCLIEHKGNLIAYSAVCPHMLGPLSQGKLTNSEVECPWHGYRFDVVSGECLTGQACKLGKAPTISVNLKTSEVTAHF